MYGKWGYLMQEGSQMAGYLPVERDKTVSKVAICHSFPFQNLSYKQLKGLIQK